jgi:H+-transporting ATPase
LTSDEARRRLAEVGPNAVAEEAPSALATLAEKFWGPVPWLLEAAIVVQLTLGAWVEAGVIGGLLLFNATLGVVQQGRAGAALAALKKRLAPTALVLRDGQSGIVGVGQLEEVTLVEEPHLELAPGEQVAHRARLEGRDPVHAVEGSQGGDLRLRDHPPVPHHHELLNPKPLPHPAGPRAGASADRRCCP